MSVCMREVARMRVRNTTPMHKNMHRPTDQRVARSAHVWATLARMPRASALGAHLIRGYAMLEDICPNAGCNSPLMRSPDGADRCLFIRSSRGPMDTASPS